MHHRSARKTRVNALMVLHRIRETPYIEVGSNPLSYSSLQNGPP